MDHEGSDAHVDFLNNPHLIYLNMKVISNQPFGIHCIIRPLKVEIKADSRVWMVQRGCCVDSVLVLKESHHNIKNLC